MIKAIIVEDDPMVAQINKSYLSEVKVIKFDNIFYNGKEALKYLLKNPIELVIVDITMPVMDGLELVRQIRANQINSDIIVVTAANDIKNLEEMLRLGIIDYLIKPFDKERFLKAIYKYLQKNNLFSSQNKLKQEEIDLIINLKQENFSSELNKGIQSPTLDRIKNYLKEANRQAYNCDNLASELNLSKVTIRRYLNYLVEIGFLINSIDYETGGRPSIIYKLNN